MQVHSPPWDARLREKDSQGHSIWIYQGLPATDDARLGMPHVAGGGGAGPKAGMTKPGLGVALLFESPKKGDGRKPKNGGNVRDIAPQEHQTFLCNVARMERTSRGHVAKP